MPESHTATQTLAICLCLSAINNAKDRQFALFLSLITVGHTWLQVDRDAVDPGQLETRQELCHPLPGSLRLMLDDKGWKRGGW